MSKRSSSQLEDPVPGGVKNQHVVTKALLRRFAIPRGGGTGDRLVRFDLDNPDWQQPEVSPRVCANILYFVSYDSAKIEALWNQTEQHMSDVFAAIDEGRAFDDQRNVELLRRFMALHLARSHWFRDIHDAAVPKVMEDLVERCLDPRMILMRRLAFRDTGRWLDRPELEQYVRRELANTRTVEDHIAGRTFRGSVERIYHQAVAKLQGWEPELVWVQRGQFIIGDIPALTLKWDGDLLAPATTVQAKVAIDDANGMILPLGPKLLLSFGPRSGTASADLRMVERVNRLQVREAQKYVFFKPNQYNQNWVRVEAHNRPGQDAE